MPGKNNRHDSRRWRSDLRSTEDGNRRGYKSRRMYEKSLREPLDLDSYYDDEESLDNSDTSEEEPAGIT
jgi:hypothetical protein